MSTDGQGTKRRRNIAENFNRLSRVHERYRRQTDRRQTDGRAIAYSEREREFTFAKNSHVTIITPLLWVIRHFVAKIDIAYICTKCDDFTSSRFNDMIAAPKILMGHMI